MARFFNFYDPLEKRYIFNSFLVVVALVEILILVFTLIWQIDFEGIFGTQFRPAAPFPWKPYLLASFMAPIALLFLFGLIIQGFEILCKPPEDSGRPEARPGRLRYLLGLLLFMVVLVFFVKGKAVFALITLGIKAIGLVGSYIFIAFLALGFLYLWVRLILRYRLQKKAMEYQYLLTLAERHGCVVVDPKAHPELLSDAEAKKNLHDKTRPLLESPDSTSNSDQQ
ncbi:MAG: hypothetical protein M1438_16895 [Deltaproteobacteria bacterium]|nr:hypothetical protein [Deltaproteobacteria bacterium]